MLVSWCLTKQMVFSYSCFDLNLDRWPLVDASVCCTTGAQDTRDTTSWPETDTIDTMHTDAHTKARISSHNSQPLSIFITHQRKQPPAR